LNSAYNLDFVLRHYPDLGELKRMEPLAGAGGFSGALLWRLTTSDGFYCLRRWPQGHPNRERLEFLQAVLWHAHQEGCYFVPLPLENLTEAGYLFHADHYWELTPWMPGVADYHDAPTVEKLHAALSALAQFHRATESFPVAQGTPAVSPGIAQRHELAAELRHGGVDKLREALRTSAWRELDRKANRALELIARALPAVDHVLEPCLDLPMPLQPCIRDIWHDHVLFLDGQVSGIVDFGAMRVDNIATDLARLLGSLVGDEREGWREGLEAYERIRPISEHEGRLIKAFDRSNVVLSLVNWLRWIYLERRTFEKREAVESRFDELLPRLERLTEFA
jgi:Ser/Thr protein kinase RdoA (MazF antagonist)